MTDKNNETKSVEDHVIDENLAADNLSSQLVALNTTEKDVSKTDNKNMENQVQDLPKEEASTNEYIIIENEEISTLDAESVNYTSELMLQSVYQDTEVSIDPKAIQFLTDGFITQFLPSLEKARSSISQIKTSQLVLIETVQQERSKFTDCQAMRDLDVTMQKAKQYHNKLLRLRKEMTNLHEKSKKLKKRALKLQQQKQKEELTRAHDMEKEYEKERMLTARVANPSD